MLVRHVHRLAARAPKGRVRHGFLALLVAASSAACGGQPSVGQVSVLSEQSPLERKLGVHDLGRGVKLEWRGSDADFFELHFKTDESWIESAGEFVGSPIAGAVLPQSALPDAPAVTVLPDGNQVPVRITAGAPRVRASASPGAIKVRLPIPLELDEAGRRRVRSSRFATDGFWAWTGAPLRFDLPDSAAGQSLRCGFTLISVGGASAEADVQIGLSDGTELDVLSIQSSPLTEIDHLEVQLPERLPDQAVLSFELIGDASLVAIHAPTIGPAHPDRYDGDDRLEQPNAVVFLADTFRADNLTAWGAQSDLTPHIDEFVEGARYFPNAWSPSSWTLPSHGSLLTSTLPRRHGATHSNSRLSPVPSTLAEVLREAGYRTALVSEGGYVSNSFGLDTGFEWFEQAPTGSSSLPRVPGVVGADDGRPLFLFVQTYRTHTPWVVTQKTLAKHGADLGIANPRARGLHDAMVAEYIRILEMGFANRDAAIHGQSQMIDEVFGALAGDAGFSAAEATDVLRGFYLATVADLDREFSLLWEHLQAQGLNDRSTVSVFTSDHGESFGDDQTWFHGRGTCDAVLRIPLALRGPGVPPGPGDGYVGLLDIAPTLTELLGLSAPVEWEGRTLLSSQPQGPFIAQDCARYGEARMALMEDGLKLVLSDTGEGASNEPGSWAQRLIQVEELSEGAVQAGDPQSLLELRGPELRAARVPLGGSEGSGMSADTADSLKALGYRD